MTRNKILSLFLFTAVLFSSCSDNFLEEKGDYDSFDESIFANEIQTGRYVDKIYNDFFSALKSPLSTVIGLYNDDRSNMTEELGGTIKDYTNPAKTLVNASDCPDYYGKVLAEKPQNHPYNRIRDCNILLEKIDKIGTELPEEFRNNCKGQMYFFRAIQLFELVRMYGGVPIVTTVLTPSSEDESIRYPRATTAECIEQVVKDLDTAAELLPMRWSNEGADYGRFTKAAALAMKSRILLTAASPLFNSDWDNSGSPLWQAALEAGLAAERDLTAGGYGLYGSSAKEWEEMFLVDNKFCKEVLMLRMCSPNQSSSVNNGWEKSIRLASQGGDGGKAAPKEMIDLFPLADGTRPTTANGYDSELFFLNRDPRFYRTFAFPGVKWGFKSNSNAMVWAYRYKTTSNKIVYANNNQLKSPAFIRKMSNSAADETSFGYSGTDIFEYRYAELLLNIAECYAAKGDVANCISYLGKIRARVGIPADNNYGLGNISDKYAALDACLYERRIELAYEGKRFWDIQRWMLYNDDDAAGNNTCAKLGIAPINGTCRTGGHWEAKVVSDSDPIKPLYGSILVDPDAANFTTQLNALADFYKENFTTVSPETPMDADKNNPVNILWRQNYYVFGLHNSILSNNSWLQQTIGWKDVGGADGTYNYRQ